MAVATTASPAEWKKIQEGFADKGLQHVFLELLGWGLGNAKVLPCEVDGEAFTPTVVADLKGYRVFLVEKNTLPSPKLQARIDGALAVQAPERISIFSDGTTMQWRWPHQTPSGGVSYESLTISASKMPSFLAQRLVGLKFSAQDFAAGVSLVDVRDRVRGRFDGAKVTKKFFDEFRKHHQHLASSIEGIDLDDNRSTYATLLMNRLMLLYFLQKREFLNDDPFYLENCLKQVQQSRGENKFYSFYRDLLLPMFFDRLAAFAPKELEPDVARIIGDIPYINGGIYEPSALEKELGPALNVPDEVFEIVLNFFGKFNWHLDTRPSGSENEINPEVIGYIFEQYINYTAGGKKDNGAYYTKEDVTGYMVGATLVPRILDYLVELKIPFLDLVAHDPRRFIHADMLHGYDQEARSWVAVPSDLFRVWEDDPMNWHVLDDAEKIHDINLPGETWVETLYRRERVDKLVEQVRGGLIGKVNDLVSHNLNARLLLTDAIDRIDDGGSVGELWKRVTSLTVLDPTCGSGAFLFAAMEALEDVYHHVIGVLRSGAATTPEISKIVDEISRHPNDRYFVRKSIALNNLYGTDLMPDAIETAQLRIFLALVSCLESREELEPLPDLDFNLKCGNLLVGFRDVDDMERFGGDFLNELALRELRPQIEDYKLAYKDFVVTSTAGRGSQLSALKGKMDGVISDLRGKANLAFAELYGVKAAVRESWIETYRPFHWFVEFPLALDRGGFDVIVGNPPYISDRNLSVEEKRQVSSYETNKCPDLYAVCFERSLSLRRTDGRLALVVMLNLVFSDRFESLRRLIFAQGVAEWWSTYGNFPNGLFSGAAVRNTIVVLGSGSGLSSTRHHIFTAQTRPNLFSTIEYHHGSRTATEPPPRGGLPARLEKTLRSSVLKERVLSGQKIYLKPTATYWFPVLPRAVPSFNPDGSVGELHDSGLKEVGLFEQEDLRNVVSALGGKIGYFWWMASGDNFHVQAKETEAPRALLQSVLDPKGSLRSLADGVFQELPLATILVFHLGVRANIRWSDLGPSTDRFAKRLLELAGLDGEWRNLHIWYRQSMRSSGSSQKDRPLAADLAKILVHGSGS